MKQRERRGEYVCLCVTLQGALIAQWIVTLWKEAQTKPRKFLANEKESNDTFYMRKEECEEMMRVRQRKTIR